MKPGVIALILIEAVIIAIWVLVTLTSIEPDAHPTRWITCQTRAGDIYMVDTPNNRQSCNGVVK